MIKKCKCLTVCELASVLKRITDGGLGAEPPAAGSYGGLGAKPPAARQFCKCLEKKSYLNPIGLHFARVQSHFKELDF